MRADSPLQDSLRQKWGIEHQLTKLVIGGEEKVLPPRPVITVKVLAEDLLGGNSGVNLYFGGFTADDQGRIHWRKPGFAITLKAGPPELMDLEQQYLGALQATQSIHVTGRGFAFETEDHRIQLFFSEVSQDRAFDSVLGKQLTLTRMIAGGKDTVLPLDTAPTLILASEGRVSGSGGINAYSGTYKIGGTNSIEFSKSFRTTRMAGPPEHMEVEHSFLSALPSVTNVHFTASGIVLENFEKTTVLEFEFR